MNRESGNQKLIKKLDSLSLKIETVMFFLNSML